MNDIPILQFKWWVTKHWTNDLVCTTVNYLSQFSQQCRVLNVTWWIIFSFFPWKLKRNQIKKAFLSHQFVHKLLKIYRTNPVYTENSLLLSSSTLRYIMSVIVTHHWHIFNLECNNTDWHKTIWVYQNITD